MVDDVCDGRNLSDYLVRVNPDDESEDNALRNRQIFDRAVFYGVAGWTVKGLVGLVFQRWPKLSVPAALDYVVEDVDGAGVSIYQQSQCVVRELVRKGRCGLLVNLLAPGESVRDARRAVIETFKAEQIINWHQERVGAEFKTTLVMLQYRREVPGEDDYQIEYRDTILELRLLDGRYVQRRWEKARNEWVKVAEVVPHDATGSPLDEIPFLFVGSETNTAAIDEPPMLNLCRVNIGHWNNSAEYEDSVFTVGQAQPWMSGATERHLEQIKYVGSSTLIGVPEGGKFDFAQPKPNTLAREAMTDKVAMMVGLGAMFIQPGSAVKTATQAEGEQRVAHSVLSLIASNVSEAYTQALLWAAQFMGAGEAVEFAVSQDFVDPRDTQLLQQITAAFATRLLPVDDYLRWLQRHGLVDPEKTLEQFREEVDSGPLFSEGAGFA